MIGILRPVAAFLPYQRALAVARSIAVVSAAMPFYGRARASHIRRTFGRDLDPSEAMRVATEHLARPLCDFVVLRRVLVHGRADFDTWHVEQRSSAVVDALRSSGESFILATGHFSRQACMPLYASEIVSQKITSIVHARKKRTINPYSWWLSHHYGQMLDCLRFAHPDMEFVHPGQIGAYRRLVATLGRTRNAVIVYADAPPATRKNGCYVRSFAGLEARSFATGAARLSRMTGRPIAVCIPYLVDDRTIVLDWIRVIRPPAGGDEKSDIAVTNLILDDIEKAIGQRPGQYVMNYLGERRWNAQAEQWVSS
jgi:lauroyl/myristoyl acyltransferase